MCSGVLAKALRGPCTYFHLPPSRPQGVKRGPPGLTPCRRAQVQSAGALTVRDCTGHFFVQQATKLCRPASARAACCTAAACRTPTPDPHRGDSAQACLRVPHHILQKPRADGNPGRKVLNSTYHPPGGMLRHDAISRQQRSSAALKSATNTSATSPLEYTKSGHTQNLINHHQSTKFKPQHSEHLGGAARREAPPRNLACISHAPPSAVPTLTSTQHCQRRASIRQSMHGALSTRRTAPQQRCRSTRESAPCGGCSPP